MSGDVSILNVSKWLNQVSIQTTDAAALAKINSFPFVDQVRAIASKTNTTRKKEIDTQDEFEPSTFNQFTQSADYFNYGLSANQIKIHHADFLHNHGFRGNGMQIAIIDAGFYRYNELQAFDSVRNNGQIISTWDFVDRNNSVAEDNSHGMHCFSIMAANMPGQFIGSAPHASYHLFRTEDVFTEYPIEEHNLACAAERADSSGADLCSVSLGYCLFDDASLDYSYNDMNGQVTMSARAIKIASQKGLIFSIAAGNEGNSSWHYITTPADADGALAIAAVNTSGNIASFSSYGPRSDGAIKPDLASVGVNTVIADAGTGQPVTGNGTSYACPNITGITSCLWQAFPETNNTSIMQALRQSGSSFIRPNDRTGYGIPDAKKAFVILQKNGFVHHETFNQCRTEFDISVKMDNSMQLLTERKFPDELSYTTISTLTGNQTFSSQNQIFTDDLSNKDYPSVQYRYRMIIANDTAYTIDSATVYFLNPCTEMPPYNDIISNSFSIHPNPAEHLLKLYFEMTEKSSVQMIFHNSNGQLVKNIECSPDKGSSTYEMNISSWNKGSYWATAIFSDKKKLTRKFIKL